MKSRPKIFVLIGSYSLVLSFFLLILFAGNRIITVYSEQKPLASVKTIVIDAGHGGEDGGASTAAGTRESEINLQIALKLNDLMNLLGMNTKMIRQTDISVATGGNTIAQRKVSDLKERVRIINETKNSTLISIHQNYYSDTRYSGTQIFYAPTQGSKECAEIMQKEIREFLQPNNHRQIKKADGIFVMQHIKCPGILIECGFLSNPEEARNLTKEDYQNKICCIISSTVSKYLFDYKDIA